MKYIEKENGIIIYQDENKKIEVSLKEETIWLDAHKMAYLFDVDRTVIVKHIKNIYKSGELEKDSTYAKIAQVAADGKRREMNVYNLDVIISVGYRVNSKRATQFRIWATNILKTYLSNDYVVNESKITQEKLKELENTIGFIKASIQTPSLKAEEVKGILEIIENYMSTWKWIREYDSGKSSRFAMATRERRQIFNKSYYTNDK